MYLSVCAAVCSCYSKSGENCSCVAYSVRGWCCKLRSVLIVRHGRTIRCCCLGATIQLQHVVYRRYPVFMLVHIQLMPLATRHRRHQFCRSAERMFTPVLRLELPLAVPLPVYVLAFSLLLGVPRFRYRTPVVWDGC